MEVELNDVRSQLVLKDETISAKTHEVQDHHNLMLEIGELKSNLCTFII